MPSGAKKRKAKKKKENQFNTQQNTSSLSHGDNLKHQDNKESDVEKVNSPASQDHHNVLLEREQGETSKEHNIVVENETSNQIEREFKIKDESTDNPEQNSSEGGSSGSSSSSNSSSDDESGDVKHTPVVVDISPDVDSLKETDLLSETAAEAILSTIVEEVGVSAVETPVVDEIVPLVEKEEVQMSSLSDSPVIQEIESLSKENGDKMLSCDADTAGILPKRREEGMVIQSVDNITAFSDSKECVVPENEDRFSLSPGEPTFDNGAEHEKDAGITQPLLGDSVQKEQKSSLKSCCGLFELFSPS